MQLAESGLRGKALTDALYFEMFGSAPPDPNRSDEERDASREKFFALMESLTEEELAEDIFQGRPWNLSILDGKPMTKTKEG